MQPTHLGLLVHYPLRVCQPFRAWAAEGVVVRQPREHREVAAGAVEAPAVVEEREPQIKDRLVQVEVAAVTVAAVVVVREQQALEARAAQVFPQR